MDREDRQEPRKVVIQRGYLYAFLGALVHIIPVSGVVTIVTLNLRGCLFGIVQNSLDRSSEWIPALQYAAKLHDIFMLASLTALVYSVISSELCLQNGIPYGALFSGLQVSHPSFLWSQEMWGMLTSDELPKLAILRMGLVILFATILGLAIGPASATLVIPRMRVSYVGSTPIWFNITDKDLFPASLEGNIVDSSCANITGRPSLNACPSSGWEELAGFASLPTPFTLSTEMLKSAHTGNWYDILLNGDSPNNTISLTDTYTKRSMYTTRIDSEAATTQNAVLAAALVAVDRLWTRITEFSKEAYLSGTSFHTLDASQPYADCYCGDGYTIEGPNDARPIPFYVDGDGEYNLTTMERCRLLETYGNATTPTLLFVNLSNFTSSFQVIDDISLGAVIINSSQSFSSCVMHTGWASAYLNTTTDSTGSVQSPDDIHSMVLRSVKIDPSWAEFLNPITDPAGARVFESLSSYSSEAGAATYQNVLATLVTNGLANLRNFATAKSNLTDSVSCAIGIPTTADCDVVEPLSSDPTYFVRPSGAEIEDWSQWEVNHYLYGLAYSRDGTVAKISIVVLLIYATFASIHALYTIVRGRSSSSWQSVSELTTLALLSQPPKDPDLQNTSAGIYGLSTFKKQVRVVAVNGGKGGDEGREGLQLVFGKEMPAGYSKVEANEEYGAIN